MDLSETIKKLRKEKGLTLEQVGDFVGVGKSTVRKWENGIIQNMRRDKISKLAQCLGVSPAHLMGWETNEKANEIAASGEIATELLSILEKMTVQQKISLLNYAYKIIDNK